MIAIIGILIAMLLPAVQAAREAARRSQCQNHLRQIALGMLNHHDTHQHFPVGGWGFNWAGESGRGFDLNQPGGWVYNVLPFVEQGPLHDLDRGLTGTARLDAGRDILQTPVSIFNCPSRRDAIAYPYTRTYDPYNTSHPTVTAQTDYAANAGDQPIQHSIGPPDYETIEQPGFSWPDFSSHTGIVYLRSHVRLAQLTDGTSNTYLVGEKYLNPDWYLKALSWGDDNSMYMGHDWDHTRWANPDYTPLQDVPGAHLPERFGSAHASGWNVAMCDGSVRMMSYSLPRVLHGRFGNRADGLPNWVDAP
ncbi:MAG: DUF1559 domain-containing protein [Planctomycetales bacterium]|nr:DUF1559 domain-containing protein [Planctomycetales bacterium]